MAKAYRSFVGKNVSHTEKLYLRLVPTQQEEYEKIVKAKYKGADGYMFLQLSMFEFIYDKLIRHFGNRLKIVYEEYNGNEIILDDSFYHKSEEEQKEIHEEIRQMYLRRFSSIVDESMTYEEMHNKVSEYYQSVLDNKETIF